MCIFWVSIDFHLHLFHFLSCLLEELGTFDQRVLKSVDHHSYFSHVFSSLPAPSFSCLDLEWHRSGLKFWVCQLLCVLGQVTHPLWTYFLNWQMKGWSGRSVILQTWDSVVCTWVWLHCMPRNGYPLQYSCLGNPMDRGDWRAAIHEVAKSQTRLRD